MTDRRVDIVIGGKTDASLQRSTGAATNAVERLAAAQKRTQQRRDGYAGAVAATRDLKVAYDTARESATRLGREVRQAGLAASGEQVAGFRAARTAAREAKVAYDGATASLSKYQAKSSAAARGGFAAVDRLASGGGAGVAQAVGAGATRTRGGILGGLRPHEVQNLGYQVNDLVTQIASGTSPMQAFAQQGGQIAQIFPSATMALLRFSPVVAAAALAVGPFAASLARASTEAKNLGSMESLLRRSGDAALYTAPQLAEVAAQLIASGASAEEARAAVERFTRDAVDPSYLSAFAETSADVAKVLGVDMKDAADKVTAAFTGNTDAILSLDDQLNFLTRSERAHIEKLKESKKEAEARTYAFDIFSRRYGETAQKMAGPWTTILTNFGQAWSSFGDTLTDAVDVDAISSDLEGLLSLIARISEQLPGVNRQSRAYLSAQHARIDADIRRYQGRIAEGRGDVPTGSPLLGAQDAYAAIANLERQRDEVNRRIAAIDGARGPTSTDTTRDPPKVDHGGGGRDRGRSEAETRARQQADFVAGLELENQAREFSLSLINRAARESEILTEIERARIEATNVGLKLTDDQAAAIRETVGALHDARAEQEASAILERTRLDLAQQRGEVESRAAFVARMSAAEMVGASEQTRRAYEATIGQAWDMAEAARQRGEAETRVNDLLNLRRALIDQIEAASTRGEGTEGLQARVTALNAEIAAAAYHALALMANLSGPAAEAVRVALQGIADEFGNLRQKAAVTAQEIDGMLVSGGVGAIDDFAQAIGDGANAFGALRDSFLTFAADFLRQIAMMIAQQAILNALGLGGGAAGGSKAGGLISSIVGGLFGTHHTGGIVGSGRPMRAASPAMFAGAHRFHTGGVVGLGPDEVPIIAKRHEEVLTEQDPRHRANGGLGSPVVNLKNNILFEPGDVLSKGLSSEAGEQALFSFVRGNAGQIKAILG